LLQAVWAWVDSEAHQSTSAAILPVFMDDMV